MAGNKRGVYPTSGKRRRSYYEFSRDYPGTKYAKNKKSSTSEALDTQKRIKIILSVVLIVFMLVASYFVTYTILEISNSPVSRNDVSEEVTAGTTAENVTSPAHTTSPRDSTATTENGDVTGAAGETAAQADGTDPYAYGDGMDTY